MMFVENEKIRALAKIVHEANRAYCESIGDHSQVPFDGAPENIQKSAMDGVRFILENPNVTSKETHDNWTKFKVADGWVYGEVKDSEKKTHPCLVDYHLLPVEQRFKDALFGAIVKTYISFIKEKDHQDEE